MKTAIIKETGLTQKIYLKWLPLQDFRSLYSESFPGEDFKIIGLFPLSAEEGCGQLADVGEKESRGQMLNSTQSASADYSQPTRSVHAMFSPRGRLV